MNSPAIIRQLSSTVWLSDRESTSQPTSGGTVTQWAAVSARSRPIMAAEQTPSWLAINNAGRTMLQSAVSASPTMAPEDWHSKTEQAKADSVVLMTRIHRNAQCPLCARVIPRDQRGLAFRFSCRTGGLLPHRQQ